ncbi:hypothetical protein DFQ26_003513 [Actinomortierella ambigua]|nr:hypothetical protein DFQ26_003513 [Actinomortierella ambigua]
MRPFLVCLLAAILPATSFASQEPFCEDGISRTGRLFGRPAFYDLEREVQGTVLLKGSKIRGLPQTERWVIVGNLEEGIPKEPLELKWLTFTMNDFKDFEGKFEGHVGREVLLRWTETGASIQGQSDYGDFEVSGTSRVVGFGI